MGVWREERREKFFLFRGYFSLTAALDPLGKGSAAERERELVRPPRVGVLKGKEEEEEEGGGR